MDVEILAATQIGLHTTFVNLLIAAFLFVGCANEAEKGLAAGAGEDTFASNPDDGLVGAEANETPSKGDVNAAEATHDDESDAATRPSGAPSLSGPCAPEQRIGGFRVLIGAASASAQGQFTNGVVPASVSVIAAEHGPCKLLMPPALFCDPNCPAGETCAADGKCVPYPIAQDIGPLLLQGVEGEPEGLSISATPPLHYYFFKGALPYPPAAPGVKLSLSTTSASADTWTLGAASVAPLLPEQSSLLLEYDQSAALVWEPADSIVGALIEVEINLANHGGVPARIECELEDVGAVEVSAQLVSALLDVGYSGFPTVSIRRRSASHADLANGCIDFRVEAESVWPVEIPGLVSCSDDEECPRGQFCQTDLVCR